MSGSRRRRIPLLGIKPGWWDGGMRSWQLPSTSTATLALLRGVPVYSAGTKFELVTPTGAALLRALNCQFSDFPRIKIDSIGYGAGTRNPKGSPNVLRTSIGELAEADKPI